MPAERDPRTDPRPGDVIEIQDHAGGNTTLGVEHVGNYVYFRPAGGRLVSDLTPKHWREFARDARVVARGAEGGTS